MKTNAWLVLLVTLAGCAAPTRATSPFRAEQTGRPIQTLAPRSRVASAASTDTMRSSAVGEVERTTPARLLPAARRAARRFFVSYLGFLYGRVPRADVRDVGWQLRAELSHGHSAITPAERATRPRLVRVKVLPAGPPASALATASFATSRGRYRITATLEPWHGGWAVVDVAG